MAVLTRGGERLDQALADPLTRHLHEPERGDLSHLVAGAVAAEALDEAAQQLTFHRVPYDVPAAAGAIRATPLPAFFADRLELGQ